MTSPFDFFNPNTEYSDDIVQKARLEICEKCPSLLNPVKICKECGCFMPLKTKLVNSVCPLNKW